MASLFLLGIYILPMKNWDIDIEYCKLERSEQRQIMYLYVVQYGEAEQMFAIPIYNEQTFW